MADYADQGGGSAAGAAIELEHAIGFGGGVSAGLHYHPNGKDLLYAAGGCVVVCDFNDPHNQVFLRGHDDDITTLALSRYIQVLVLCLWRGVLWQFVIFMQVRLPPCSLVFFLFHVGWPVHCHWLDNSDHKDDTFTMRLTTAYSLVITFSVFSSCRDTHACRFSLSRQV